MSSNLSNLKYTDKEQGVAILEFAIVLPFLLLAILCSVEIKRYMSLIQQAQVFTREAASQVYRSCTDFVEPEGEFSGINLDRTRRCVVDILGTPVTANGLISSIVDPLLPVAPIVATNPGLQTFANDLLGINKSNIVVSVYRYDNGTGLIRELAKIGEYTNIAEHIDRTSRFQLVANNIVNPRATLDANFLQAHQRVVIVEVFSQYEPVIGFVPIFGALIPHEVYEIAIL
jgi:hypothetical protein